MKYLRSFYKRHRGMAALALLLLLGQVVGSSKVYDTSCR